VSAHDYACIVCGKPDARMHEDADHWYCEEHYPEEEMTAHIVEIPDTSIEAWLDGAVTPDPKGDFGRELSALFDRCRDRVDPKDLAAKLEVVAKVPKGGTP